MQDIILNYRGRIRAIIKKLTGSYNEDIEQEVFIKTWRSFSQYHEEGKISQWIGAITTSVCRDYFRSKQVKAEQKQEYDNEVIENIASGINQEDLLDSKIRQKIILKAVNNLPPKMKEVVILCEFEDLTVQQTANKLGIPVGTVKSRLFNAHKILAVVLKPLQGE